jgi:hypothetical protein
MFAQTVGTQVQLMHATLNDRFVLSAPIANRFAAIALGIRRPAGGFRRALQAARLSIKSGRYGEQAQ